MDILSFALLVPGAAQSAGARDSEYNGLPGGAINITLDGVNNNSQRFRSGGTSFFSFAPIRLGAIEEVTVSTAGLTYEAGAEGAGDVAGGLDDGLVAQRATRYHQWTLAGQEGIGDASGQGVYRRAVLRSLDQEGVTPARAAELLYGVLSSDQLRP